MNDDLIKKSACSGFVTYTEKNSAFEFMHTLKTYDSLTLRPCYLKDGSKFWRVDFTNSQDDVKRVVQFLSDIGYNFIILKEYE